MLFNGFLVLLALMGAAAFVCVLLAFRAPMDEDPPWEDD